MAQKMLLLIQLQYFKDSIAVMNTQPCTGQSGSKAPQYKYSRGFTLVEVVIIMSIIGLLAVIGYPTLSRFIPNYELKAATRQLQGDFQRAKLHAVKRNRDVIFSFNAVYTTTQLLNTPCTGATTSYTFTDPDGVVVASNSFDGLRVCLLSSNFGAGSGFDSRGMPAGLPGTVQLKHFTIPVRDAYEISQSSAGSIRIK